MANGLIISIGRLTPEVVLAESTNGRLPWTPKVEGNILKVNILERDTDLDLVAGCDECCYLMPIEYAALTAEEIESIKTIEIYYEGKNHRASFPIDGE